MGGVDRGSVDRVSGAGVVVTGAGAGIGRALARGLAAAGARVVVNDLDTAAATAVAEQIGGYPAPGDTSTEPGVRALIAEARDFLGEIDIYCSNAGIAIGTGPDTPDAIWQRAWEVNVLAHVRASRELLPAWLERGRGCFVVTASAAGLLTMLGTAHLLGDQARGRELRGVARRHLRAPRAGRALHLPAGRTDLHAGPSGEAGKVVLQDAAIEPEQVGRRAVAGLADGRFLILPHPEVRGYYEMRASDTDKWLRGMNRMQQRIEEVERPERS